MTALEMNTSALDDIATAIEETLPLSDGQARIAVRRFSLTANNVTYGVFGHMMQYWAFFPASEAGRGRVPVWGFGEVVESACHGVPVGMRVYGYFPLGDTLVVEPGKVRADSFVDITAHRQPMAAAYNRYEIVAEADAETEGRLSLLKPLFITGFLLDDWIASEGFFGADSVIASSASSKTALSMAARLKARGGVEVVGLTSARSRAFVEATGLYDRVATYDDVAALGMASAVYVDFAGDAKVTRAVHVQLGDALKKSVIVGGAHWDAPRTGEQPPGPTPELFFAPSHVGRLGGEWGSAVFNETVGAALADFAGASKGWLDVHEVTGLEGAATAWQRLLKGEVGPREGVVVVL